MLIFSIIDLLLDYAVRPSWKGFSRPVSACSSGASLSLYTRNSLHQYVCIWKLSQNLFFMQ